MIPVDETSSVRTLRLRSREKNVRVLNAGPQGHPLARVVIVHGYGEHAGRYRHLAAALATRRVAVTVMDLPGHGESEDEPGDLGGFRELDGLIADASAASARWNGDVPLTLFGHSLGGLILAGYVLRESPEASIALSAPVLGRWSAIEAFREADSIPPSLIRARHLSADLSFAREYDAHPLLYRGPLKRRVLNEAAVQLTELEHSGALSGRRTLWMHGADDRVVRSTDVLRALADLEPSDLTVRILPGARHEVLNDISNAVAMKLLSEFILSAPTSPMK